MSNQRPPVEFSQLGLDTNSFKYSDARSWRGACPSCGGYRRFVVFTDKQFPDWNFMCDGCGWKGWAKDLNINIRQSITEEQRRKWAQKSAAHEQERITKLEKTLSEYTRQEVWIATHNYMQNDNRAWWRAQGVPDSLQDYWQLGYEKNYTYNSDSGRMVTPAYTIPYFHHQSSGDPKFLTIQYRLANTLNPNDRYRFAYGLRATYYTTEPYQPLNDVCIICEGAKKAMNVSQIVDPNKYSVIAQPSKSGDYGVGEAVKNCGRVFVIFDPDGQRNAHDKAKQIGKAARVVELNDKVDDMIIAGRLDERSFEIALRHAL